MRALLRARYRYVDATPTRSDSHTFVVTLAASTRNDDKN
jgi:hypothetical protein